MFYKISSAKGVYGSAALEPISQDSGMGRSWLGPLESECTYGRLPTTLLRVKNWESLDYIFVADSVDLNSANLT